MFLTEQELIDLTGYHRPKSVRKWLDSNGYRYAVGADGWPRVLKESVYSRLLPNHRPEPRLNLA